jgi:uncharacterized protein (DUF849 family)
VHGWSVVPDVASVNLSEAGAVELCRALWQRGVQVEAGLVCLEDARLLAGEGIARYCRRALIEVEASDAAEAVAAAQEIDELLVDLMVPLPRVWHGVERATWAVVAAGARAGSGVRIGLEDTLELPDGRPAPGNPAMVLAAGELLRRAGAR